MATEIEVANHLDLSDRSVRELKRRSVLPAAPRGGLDIDACRVAYIRHLRDGAAGRDSSRPGSLEAERARLAAAQAEGHERKNARDRGELVSLPDVSAAVLATFAHVTARLSLVGARVAAGNHKLRAKVDAAINDALEELSRTKIVGGRSERKDTD